MDTPVTHKFIIPDTLDGKRVDQVIPILLPDISRGRGQQLITEGHAALNDVIPKTTTKVRTGQSLDITIPPATTTNVIAQDIPLDILFEDTSLIVLNKPAGMVVHPAAGNEDGTLVNALLYHCGDNLAGIGGEKRPGIVHRLDKDTSGVMVIAKDDVTHAHLAGQFEHRTLQRAYKALVWGHPIPDAGMITGNIGRHPTHRKKMAVLPSGGRYAETHYSTKETYEEVSLIECRLKTGRTHQIRVHLRHLGYPLVGDQVYGKKPKIGVLHAFPRQALHAYLLGFTHPKTLETLTFKQDLPTDFQDLIQGLP